MTDSNTQEIVRAITRNTAALDGIAKALKALATKAKGTDATMGRLIEVEADEEDRIVRTSFSKQALADHEGRVVGISSPVDSKSNIHRVFGDPE